MLGCFGFENFKRERRENVGGPGGLPPGKGIEDIAPDTLVRLS